jgi:uncharacterized protein involved in exopolysaccharide biosynthesis
MPLPTAAAAFRSRIQVEPVPGSRLVNLHFRAYDPQVAASAVNALAQLYIEQSLELRFTTSTEATGWLSDRLKEQQAKIDASERALQEYREKEGFVGQESREELVTQKLGTLNGALLEARTDRIAKETLYNQIASMGPSQIESFPLVMSSTQVQALKNDLLDLRKREAAMSEALGDKHPDMVNVRIQIRQAEERIRGEMRNVTRAAESEYRTAVARESRLAANLETVKAEAQDSNRKSQYMAKKRSSRPTASSTRPAHKTKQTGLETELKTTNIRVIEKAEAPRSRSRPRRRAATRWRSCWAADRDRPFARLRAHGQHLQDAGGRARAHPAAVPGNGARRGAQAAGRSNGP